jgi:hypothetical protein
MATHDYIISNASGAAVRADLNNALAAIVTNNSSATAPTTTYAYQWWADTGSSPAVMKLRNAANSAWITLFQLDGEWTTVALENGTAAAPSLYFLSSGTDTGLYSPGTDQVGIATAGTARLAVDATGRTLLGTGTTARANLFNTTTTAALQVEGTTVGTSGGLVTLNSADANSPFIAFAKSRGATVGSNTVIQNNDGLGHISFQGSDGTEFVEGASIRAFVDGTPGANDLPTRLVFATTADAGSTPTTRATIDSSGRLLIGPSSARSNFFRPFASSAAIQTEGTSSNAATVSVVRNSNDSSPSYFVLGKSRGTVNASNTIVQSSDTLGGISFQGADGGDLTEAARISAEVDGTPGTADMPGRLLFATTADGASSPTERARIDSSGRLLVGSTANSGNQCLIQSRNDSTGKALELQRSSDNTNSPALFFTKSRGTQGSPTEVLSGDQLGVIVFSGYDGAVYNDSAFIYAEADADWTTSGDTTDNPSRLLFATTADGASSPTERMRLTSGGELLVGGTNDNGAYNIQCNGTGIWAFGAYVNGSDERLKEDITPLAPTFELVKQLNPVSFRYKEEYTSDTAIQPGFIAQELQQILEDQPYIDGIVQAGPEFLSVAYQSLIPVLTKALQEAIAKIETLEAKVAALEAA